MVPNLVSAKVHPQDDTNCHKEERLTSAVILIPPTLTLLLQVTLQHQLGR